MPIPRPKLNYANTIATIALFVALGGAAVAAGLPKKSVGPQQLKPGAVTTKALHKKAVTAGKLAPKAVTAGKLGANAVLPGNLGNGVISTEKLGDGSVIAGKIKNGAVTTNKLNNGAVTTAKLGDGSVTSAKLGNGAVNTSKLADGSVTISKLAKGEFVTPNLLATGQSERGTFMLGGNTTIARDAISFPVPLASVPHARIVPIGTPTTECPGRPHEVPNQIRLEAEPGYLCIYVALTEGKNPALQLKYGETNLGAGLEATFNEAEPANTIFGFWTVTAP